MVVPRVLVLVALVVLAGCSSGGHSGKRQQPSGPPLVIPKPSRTPTGPPRPALAGAVCGKVDALGGYPARVVVVKGRTTCVTALRVFRKYYDPTTPAEGSAGLAVIDRWTCSTRLRVATCTLRTTTIQARG
ncbi:hypothetical protein [Actinoallomurus iriomotensis]|uniref:Lipoprotein n=1 Tax=Actinoallomurus iriomotensis TaxID=478107 RepID=A0A9W6S263_9ACTN|nr:hypothetical protein [Actinoallomurus iriomotensis]GLY87161.1 hypothetical protein Airi02_050900 [Actinoallomurus iriomotensis]